MLMKDGARLLNVGQLTAELEGVSRETVEAIINQPGFKYFRLPGKKWKYYLEYKVVEQIEAQLLTERV